MTPKIRLHRKNNIGMDGGLIKMLEIEIAKLAAQYCDTCIGLGDCPLPMKGYIPIPPDDERKELYGEMEPPWAWAKCQHLLAAEQQRQQSAAMAGKWKERELSTYQVNAGNKEAYNACVDYAKRLNPFVADGLLLYGPVGTGKTHLAVGILKECFRRGLIGTQMKVPDLLEEIRRGYDSADHTKEDKARNTFLVILDDLGAEKVTDWVREKLFSIIDHRYEKQKPLIVTTNCTPKELTERIGERITDRLREMCAVHEIKGNSYRGAR
jgi:DNA replication protein DnaC